MVIGLLDLERSLWFRGRGRGSSLEHGNLCGTQNWNLGFHGGMSCHGGSEVTCELQPIFPT